MINVGTLAKIRRMHLRDGLPIKEIERRTGLARNTIKVWLRKGEMVQPKYPQRVVVSKLDGFTEMLATWLKADQHRGKRDRRTIKALYEALAEQSDEERYYNDYRHNAWLHNDRDMLRTLRQWLSDEGL